MDPIHEVVESLHNGRGTGVPVRVSTVCAANMRRRDREELINMARLGGVIISRLACRTHPITAERLFAELKISFGYAQQCERICASISRDLDKRRPTVLDLGLDMFNAQLYLGIREDDGGGACVGPDYRYETPSVPALKGGL